MKYLLDISILVAWGWKDHSDHSLIVDSIAIQLRKKEVQFLTSAIPELGFIRISIQRSPGEITPQQASRVLESMLHALGKQHFFFLTILLSTIGLIAVRQLFKLPTPIF